MALQITSYGVEPCFCIGAELRLQGGRALIPEGWQGADVSFSVRQT